MTEQLSATPEIPDKEPTELTEKSILGQVLSATGIEIDDDGSEPIWWVSADPGPIYCHSLTEALRAWQHLSYVDATRDLAQKFPHRDIPIRFSNEPRAVRRWQIDIEFSGGESPELLDALEASASRTSERVPREELTK